MKAGMKKILPGIIILAIISLTTALQAAEPLKVSISSNMQEWFGIMRYERDAGQKFNSFGINIDNEIVFSAQIVLDSSLEIEARLAFDVYNDDLDPSDNRSVGIDEEWILLRSGFGKIYAGAKESINYSLHHQLDDYIGYDNVDLWVRTSTAGLSTFALGTNPWNQTSFEQLADDVPMVGYISPKVAGFQLGLTYVPNPKVGTNRNVNNADGTPTDYWDVTLAYAGEFGDVSTGFSGGYAQQDNTGESNVRAWNTGLMIGYAGFTLGTSYLQVQHPGVSANDGHAWNTGLAYANGPWGVSYTYFQKRHRGNHSSGRNNEKFQTHLLSGKYALGPGMDLKSSFFHGKYSGQDWNADSKNTWGYGLVSGLDIIF